jgi:CRISPR/Cas system CSM-associated protein Csm2 small subunit
MIYDFIYRETEENKDLWKAIHCSDLLVEPIAENFKRITIFAENKSELEEVLENNLDTICMILG